mmetsp:Transcript_14795/g.51552  ORF Transcript_14795/g.51552 Transcript_14795/m.51552 type:complete len:335 (-) Transcript_14795:961-1965(-)
MSTRPTTRSVDCDAPLDSEALLPTDDERAKLCAPMIVDTPLSAAPKPLSRRVMSRGDRERAPTEPARRFKTSSPDGMRSSPAMPWSNSSDITRARPLASGLRASVAARGVPPPSLVGDGAGERVELEPADDAEPERTRRDSGTRELLGTSARACPAFDGEAPPETPPSALGRTVAPPAVCVSATRGDDTRSDDGGVRGPPGAMDGGERVDTETAPASTATAGVPACHDDGAGSVIVAGRDGSHPSPTSASGDDCVRRNAFGRVAPPAPRLVGHASSVTTDSSRSTVRLTDGLSVLRRFIRFCTLAMSSLLASKLAENDGRSTRPAVSSSDAHPT